EDKLREAGISRINPGIEGVVEEVTVLRPDGSSKTFVKSQLGFGNKKHSIFRNRRLIAYRIKLRLEHRDEATIRRTIEILRDVR
ncbi:unnamed protein product, partial [marine sediment metagenome]